ncbi:hypothetical protein COCNU_scaffold000565G000010 [Cocos nucifera]|nr:hypothetical protein [Cocos nucifera]
MSVVEHESQELWSIATTTSRILHNTGKFMECSIELSAEVMKHKIGIKMPKITKNKALKTAREASVRADVAKRRAEDAETVLERALEENFWLLGIQEAQATKIKEIKSQFAKAEELQAKVAEAKTTLKVIEEEIVKLQSKLKV